MKKIHILSILVLMFSCTNKKTKLDDNKNIEMTREIIIPEFQTLIDSANVVGSILIYDLKADKYYSNNFIWAKKGHLPASTFKIPNSIIAIETGVVENDSSLFKWDGKERRLKVWERDMILKEAFHYSCVPCYQEIARKVGAKRMLEYLDKLEYGVMQVDSTNIDMFWLEGESRINQFQQLQFLKRFYNSELPISQRTESIMKKMMVIDENETYRLSGKTGWSVRNGKNNGWFIGITETKGNTYFFATNIEPNQKFNLDKFPKIRTELTVKALQEMGIIN